MAGAYSTPAAMLAKPAKTVESICHGTQAFTRSGRLERSSAHVAHSAPIGY